MRVLLTDEYTKKLIKAFFSFKEVDDTYIEVITALSEIPTKPTEAFVFSKDEYGLLLDTMHENFIKQYRNEDLKQQVANALFSYFTEGSIVEEFSEFIPAEFQEIMELLNECYENTLDYNEAIDVINNYVQILKNQYIKTAVQSILADKNGDAFEKIKGIVQKFNKINRIANTVVLTSGNLDTVVNQIMKERQNDKRPISLLMDFGIAETRRLIAFASYTGGGKSHMLVHIAADYIMNAEKINNKQNSILFFSFENTKAETFLRILSNITNIKVEELKIALNDEEKLQIVKEIYNKNVKPWNKIYIYEIPSQISKVTYSYIEAKILDVLERNENVYAVIIDYMDLMHSNDDQQVWRTQAQIAKDLKFLAMRYNVPIITATQLNRGGEELAKKKGEIEKTHIGESYSKIQQYDVLIGLLTQKIVNNSVVDRIGKISILKHRYGKEADIPIKADFSRSKFFKFDSSEDEIKYFSLYENEELPISDFEKNSGANYNNNYDGAENSSDYAINKMQFSDDKLIFESYENIDEEYEFL